MNDLELNSYFLEVGKSLEALAYAVSVERLSIEFQPTAIIVTFPGEGRKTIPIEHFDLDTLRARLEQHRTAWR